MCKAICHTLCNHSITRQRKANSVSQTEQVKMNKKYLPPNGPKVFFTGRRKKKEEKRNEELADGR